MLERLQTTKAVRAWNRYGAVRGNVLAGGVAYFAFFSLIPALTLGFTVFGLVMGGRADLQAHVVTAVNSTFGGTTVIGAEAGEGLVQMDQLVQKDALTVSGLLAFVVLVFSGLGWIGALRDGVSAVFGRGEGPNPVTAKLADLLVLAVFGVSVLASTVGSVLVTAASGPVLRGLGLDGGGIARALVSVLSALVLLVADVALFLLLFRLLSGVRLVTERVFTGALAGGVALGVLKLLGGVLLRYVSGHGVLAASGVVVGLLVWMNLAARATLLASAWAAVSTSDAAEAEASARAAAEHAAASAPPPSWAVPTYSDRAADRAVIAAGALLGVAAAVSTGILREAVGAAWSAVRGGAGDEPDEDDAVAAGGSPRTRGAA